MLPSSLMKRLGGLIDITAVYAVHGEDAVMGSATPQRAATTPTTPFGAYTGPSVSVPPGRTPVISRKANSFRKTVALVSLTSDHSKPSTSKASGIQYKIITQLIVTLEAGHCSLATVAEFINQQVGFPVVLLDSKCYRIIESSTTNSTEFWKSNRKTETGNTLPSAQDWQAAAAKHLKTTTHTRGHVLCFKVQSSYSSLLPPRMRL